MIYYLAVGGATMHDDLIFLVNKEKGVTSRDVVNDLCRKFHTKRIGHTGTLDPLATGVLVVAMNEATKVVSLLTSTSKEYLATVEVGRLTDTLDTTGKVLKEERVDFVFLERLKDVLSSFQKTYLQEVPKYSAVKVKGRRLYDYARSQEEIELPKREVTIQHIELVKEPYFLNHKWYFSFSCTVSKGTYIRSLIRDMGDLYGIPFTMSDLVRTKQGRFQIEDAKRVEDLSLEDGISIFDSFKDEVEVVSLNDRDSFHVSNGMVMPKVFSSSFALMVDSSNRLLAIYQTDEKDSSLMRPFKIFHPKK